MERFEKHVKANGASWPCRAVCLFNFDRRLIPRAVLADSAKCDAN